MSCWVPCLLISYIYFSCPYSLISATAGGCLAGDVIRLSSCYDARLRCGKTIINNNHVVSADTDGATLHCYYRLLATDWILVLNIFIGLIKIFRDFVSKHFYLCGSGRGAAGRGGAGRGDDQPGPSAQQPRPRPNAKARKPTSTSSGSGPQIFINITHSELFLRQSFVGLTFSFSAVNYENMTS